MFGSQILVAPLLESGISRTVYLPRSEWIDYQSGKDYCKGSYQTIKVGEIPVILVRDEQSHSSCSSCPALPTRYNGIR